MKRKNIFFIVILIIVLSSSLSFFFYQNKKNYEKIKEIKYDIVKHPEFLPEKNMAKASSFGFSNLKADLYRLEAVQYIWSNAISSDYKKYLYQVLDLITELNPYFEKPYETWELLLSSYHQKYEDLSEQEQKKHTMQAIKLWLKWIDNFCDPKKVEAIENEFDLGKIWTQEKYKDPCKSHIIPYYLGYIYFYMLNDWDESSKYYKISWANTNAVKGAKNLAAIMKSKGWDREKSIKMFLDMARYVEWKDNLCSEFANQTDKLMQWVINWNISLNSDLLKIVESNRKIVFEDSENNSNDSISQTQCASYANKAVREINLYYLDEANKKYKKEKKLNAKNVDELYDNWYIDYKPIDFQQEKNYWIKYIYKQELWIFDVKMLKH